MCKGKAASDGDCEHPNAFHGGAKINVVLKRRMVGKIVKDTITPTMPRATGMSEPL
jgi:hypothetical protein